MTRAAAVLIVSTFLLGSVAYAAPKDTAESLIQEGIKLRRVGRDDAALEKFDRSYGMKPTPRAAAQKGLCLQALGRFTEAEDLLASSLEGDADPWVAKNRDTIKASLEDVKTKIGRFEISGSPTGAQVTVDGRAVGQLPLPGMVRINAGPAELRVQAEGYVSENTNLRVEGASFRRLEFRLKKDATAVAAPSLMPTNTDDTVVTTASGVHADESATEQPVYKKAWFWGVVGAAVVGAVLTAVVLSSGKEVTGPQVNDTAAL